MCIRDSTYPESIGNRLSASVVWKNGSEETIYVGDQEVMRVTDAQSTIKNVKDDIGYLGRFPTGGDSAYWYNQSDVAEVLIYNRALTLAEIQQINSYLEDKYQISAQVVLESITVTPPANTVYTVGEELDLTGMEVTARYTDGSIKAITEGFKVTGYDKDRPGEQTITISYTEQGLEKTATFTVTVRSAVEPEVLESITCLLYTSKPVEDHMAYRGKLAFRFQDEEQIHGLGQGEEGIYDYRGHVQYLYQHNMRIPIPFFLSTRGYGILIDNGSLMTWGDDERGSYIYIDSCEQLDYYVITGDRLDKIIDGYRELTGKAVMLPKWAFGYIQSKEVYHDQDEFLETARRYREKNIPIDCLVQDWDCLLYTSS